MLVLILYCVLFRSIISSVVPPLPASDCALIHQRWKSSNQWRRGWAGFVFIHHLAACQWQKSSRSYFQVLVWPLVTCLARRSLPGHQVGQPEPRCFQSQKTVQGVKNVCFFQRFTFSDHSLAVTALHCGYGPAPLARVFTASLDQVVRLRVLVMLIDMFVFMYASGVSRLQPDKRGTASGRFLHQPAHLSGS